MADVDVDLKSRIEATREKYVGVVRFGLSQIMDHFHEGLKDIGLQFTVADELRANGKKTECQNIWRAQIVFVAGALDFYMHELTKFGLHEIYDGNWGRTEKYSNIQIRLSAVEEALKSRDVSDWFLEYINELYQGVTMVSYKSVKEQINLLGLELKGVADGAFYQEGATEKTQDKLKRRLNELFARRNMIAHQMDRSHADAALLDISKEIVEGFIADVEKIVCAMDSVAKNMSLRGCVERTDADKADDLHEG